MANSTPGAGVSLLSHANVPVLRMKMSDEEEWMRNCSSVWGGGGGGWIGKQCMYAWAPAAYTGTTGSTSCPKGKPGHFIDVE